MLTCWYTAAAINDLKTANKHSSFALFQVHDYDNTKSVKLQGAPDPHDQGLCPWAPPGA